MPAHSRARWHRPGTVGWSVLAGVVLILCARQLHSESMLDDVVEVPVDRVVKNIEARLTAAPNDVQLRINLARTHMMAFVAKTNTVGVSRYRGESAGPATLWMEGNVLPKEKTTNDPERAKAAREHLAQAVSEYERVIALAPDNALARLGYAWSLQSSGERAKAIDAYRATIRISLPVDTTKSTLMGMQTITEEAAKYLVPLLDPTKDADEIARLKSYSDRIAPMKRMITPIAVPLRDGMNAFDVVNPSARVPFDLDGSGVRRPWTWIASDAGWLVMDLHRRRRIESGLQLFGSVTFWLFWDNGYDALRALDDDGNGLLQGAELTGLAIWRDADGNGVSHADEVRPLSDWKIVELSCDFIHDAGHPDEIAMSPNGVRLADGRTRPTFDVVLHSWPVQ